MHNAYNTIWRCINECVSTRYSVVGCLSAGKMPLLYNIRINNWTLFSKPNRNNNNLRGQNALVIKPTTTHFLIGCHAPLGSLSNTTQAPAPVNKQTAFTSLDDKTLVVNKSLTSYAKILSTSKSQLVTGER